MHFQASSYVNSKRCIKLSRMMSDSSSATTSCSRSSARLYCVRAISKRSPCDISTLPVQSKRQRRKVNAVLQQLLVAQVFGRCEYQVALAVALALVARMAPLCKGFGAAQRQRRLGRFQKHQGWFVH